MYLIKSPYIFKWIYPQLVWKINTCKKEIYLTFDDGPHPAITPFVLDMLQQYNAKATFFCIGKNVADHPEIYNKIIAHGHAAGNHTHNHLNGWKTDNDEYINNISKATEYINSDLFRPPYGRIKKSQVQKIKTQNSKLKIIMWSVLSGDFDTTISGKTCSSNVINNTKKGSIVVFHDSEKAWERLQTALPETLEYFSKKGFVFKKLDGTFLK